LKTTNNQILAVWGSPSSGKTTIAAKIAKYISNKRKNVILVLCETAAPSLPELTPPYEIEVKQSLGSILAATMISDNLIMQNSILLKKNSYISVIGMLVKENEGSYPRYTNEQATQFMNHLRNIAPYIIIDCGCHIFYDVLSKLSVVQADAVLRIVNGSIKSFSYFSSQESLLTETHHKYDSHIKVANNVKSVHPMATIEQKQKALILSSPIRKRSSIKGYRRDFEGHACQQGYKGFRKSIEAMQRRF
jgi:CO dehydrogenase nickel-insertion accessory protein CooC1